MQHRVPNAAVTFLDASSAEQLRLLGEGRIDIAIVHQHPPDHLDRDYCSNRPSVSRSNPATNSATNVSRYGNLTDSGSSCTPVTKYPANTTG